MTLITFVLTLALVGFLLWLIVTYIPMPDPFKTVLIVIAVIFVVLYVLQAIGFVGPGLPRLR